MTTQAEIIRAALTHVGEAVDAGNPSFGLARLRFNSVRDRLLADTRWNFAIGFVFLTPSTGDAIPPDTTLPYNYALPNDMIRFLGANDPLGPLENYGIDTSIIWKVVGNELWSDGRHQDSEGEEGLFAWYVKRIEDISMWDPLFTEVMILEMALVVGSRGREGRQILRHLQEQRDRLMARAKVANAQENTPETLGVEAGWQSSRGGGYGGGSYGGYGFPGRGATGRLAMTTGALPAGGEADDVLLRNSHNVPDWGKVGTNNILQGAIDEPHLSADVAEKLNAAGGDENVQADWDETDTDSDRYIANKPTIPTSLSELGGEVGEAQIADDAVTLDQLDDGIGELIQGALQRDGGTMAGALTLAGDPTDDAHASTKRYVDAVRSALNTLAATVGMGALIREEAVGTIPGSASAEQISGVTVADNANVGYALTAGTTTEFTLGSALRAARAGSAVSVGEDVSFYSNSQGHLLAANADASAVAFSVWVVRDIRAIRAAVQAAGGAGGPDQTARDAAAAAQAKADAALPADDARVGRIPSDGGAASEVWKKGPNNEAADWRPDATADAGTGGTDQTARDAAAAAKAVADAALPKAGGAMSGKTTAPATAEQDPAGTLTTKGYVDAGDDGLERDIRTKVSKTGDTMTGPLTLPGSPTDARHAADKGYVDSVVPAPAEFVAFKVAKQANATPQAANFSIDSSNGRATMPSYGGELYWFLARLESEPDIANVYIGGGGTNQIGAFVKLNSTLEIGGDDYAIWRSRNQVANDEATEIRVSTEANNDAGGLLGLVQAEANRGWWLARQPGAEGYHFVHPPMKIVTTPWAATQTHYFGTVLSHKGKWWALTSAASIATGVTGAASEPGKGDDYTLLADNPFNDAAKSLLARLALLKYAFEDEHTKTWDDQASAASGGWAGRASVPTVQQAAGMSYGVATFQYQRNGGIGHEYWIVRIPRDRQTNSYRLSFRVAGPPGTLHGDNTFREATFDLTDPAIIGPFIRVQVSPTNLRQVVGDIFEIGRDADYHYIGVHWQDDAHIESGKVQVQNERVRWLGDLSPNAIKRGTVTKNTAVNGTAGFTVGATGNDIPVALNQHVGTAMVYTAASGNPSGGFTMRGIMEDRNEAVYGDLRISRDQGGHLQVALSGDTGGTAVEVEFYYV